MELLYQFEYYNTEGQRMRKSIYLRADGRRPDIIAKDPDNPTPEHVEKIEIFDSGEWLNVEERILENLIADKTD